MYDCFECMNITQVTMIESLNHLLNHSKIPIYSGTTLSLEDGFGTISVGRAKLEILCLKYSMLISCFLNCYKSNLTCVVPRNAAFSALY